MTDLETPDRERAGSLLRTVLDLCDVPVTLRDEYITGPAQQEIEDALHTVRANERRRIAAWVRSGKFFPDPPTRDAHECLQLMAIDIEYGRASEEK